MKRLFKVRPNGTETLESVSKALTDRGITSSGRSQLAQFVLVHITEEQANALNMDPRWDIQEDLTIG